jgi:anti-sigma-K factor RskA
MTGKASLMPEWRERAAEYALGVLVGEELAKAQELERTNADFRNEVSRWVVHLSPLLEEVDEVPPPASAWAGIVRHIGAGAANDNVVELRRGLKRWRRIATGMSALAACLAIVLLAGLQRSIPSGVQVPAQNASPMVAMLGDPQAGTKVVASWDPDVDQLVLAVPGELSSDPRHSHELWVIPKGGKPRSLGTLPTSKQMHMRLAEGLARLLEQGATIAISVEPRGGSPTGAPTGPVVASGALTPA